VLDGKCAVVRDAAKIAQLTSGDCVHHLTH
jgi:hypothetical protein